MNSSNSPNLQQSIRQHQERLLKQTERFLQGEVLLASIREAFLATPRHQFTPRFSDGRPGLWSDVGELLLLEHLDTLYADQPFCIYRNEHGDVVSTISQPSLVIYMLHLLELELGMSVFELGGGSAWNAALTGRVIGSEGHVFSVEVEAALIENAQQALNDSCIENVSLISGDAMLGLSKHGPFDRGIFTASAWDLPTVFFDQIKDGGLLLFVLKFSDEFDLLTALRKTPDAFVSELHFPCRFVPIAGKHALDPETPTSESERAFKHWLAAKGLEPDALNLTIQRANKSIDLPSNAHRYTREECSFTWSYPYR